MAIYIRQDAHRTPWANTIAYYPLTASSTVNDESWNSNTLTNNSGVTFWTYQWVDCAYFDGSSYLTQTSLSYSWGSITMSAWGYSVARNVEWSDEWFVRFWPNFWCYVWWSSRALVCSPWGIGTQTWVSESWWKLVTVTFDGTDMNLYINWTLDASNQPTIPTGSWLAIWNTSTSWSFVWQWGIGDVILESVAWSAQEVSDYYDASKTYYGIS